MLSMQPKASTPIRLSRLNQTTLACAAARADFNRRLGALAQRDLPRL